MTLITMSGEIATREEGDTLIDAFLDLFGLVDDDAA